MITTKTLLTSSSIHPHCLIRNSGHRSQFLVVCSRKPVDKTYLTLLFHVCAADVLNSNPDGLINGSWGPTERRGRGSARTFCGERFFLPQYLFENIFYFGCFFQLGCLYRQYGDQKTYSTYLIITILVQQFPREHYPRLELTLYYRHVLYINSMRVLKWGF